MIRLGLVEVLALVLAGLVLLETLALVLHPGGVVEFARSTARHKTLLQGLYVLLGAVLLYHLLGSYSLREILGIGVVVVLFYGAALMPYYDAVLDRFERDYEEGRMWGRMGVGLLVWVVLAVLVLVEWAVTPPA